MMIDIAVNQFDNIRYLQVAARMVCFLLQVIKNRVAYYLEDLLGIANGEDGVESGLDFGYEG